MNHEQYYTYQKQLQQYILSQNCSHFFTGTFAKLQSAHSAYTHADRFFRTQKFKGWGFVAVESAHGVRPHIHGVLRFDTPVPSESAGSLYVAWERRYGFARMEESRDSENVSAYVSKYITKEKTDYYLIL